MSQKISSHENIIIRYKNFLYNEINAFSSKFSGFSIKEIAVFSLIIFILNIFFLSNFSLSIDDEMYAVAPSSRWWISIGRWTVALLEKFIFKEPVIPYVPYFFFSICLAISYSLLIQSHKVNDNFIKYFSLPVLTAYPLWQLINGFDCMLPAISVGLLSVSFSSFLFSNNTFPTSIKKINFSFISMLIIQILCMAVAIGAYQAFILLYIAMCVGILLVNTLETKKSISDTVKGLAQIAIVSLFSLFVYFIIANLARYVTHTASSSYLSDFIDIQTITNAPIVFFESIFVEIFKYYAGNAGKFGTSFISSGIVIAFSFLTIIAQLWRKNLSGADRCPLCND